MKEMFDISYTVHRMAEEKARRNHLKTKPQDDQRVLFRNAVNAQGEENDDTSTEEDTDETSSLQTSASEGKIVTDKQLRELQM